jgi:hypothetical protein
MSTLKDKLANLKATPEGDALQASANALEANKKTAAESVATAAAALDPLAPIKYQHYSSSRVSTRLVTPAGRPIAFAHYKFITSDQECIDYLDDEIAKGLRDVVKGELLTHEESDPMAVYKKQVIAEYEAGKAEEALKTATQNSEYAASKINPASTADQPK